MLSPPPVPLGSSLPPYPSNFTFFFSVFKKHKQTNKKKPQEKPAHKRSNPKYANIRPSKTKNSQTKQKDRKGICKHTFALCVCQLLLGMGPTPQCG